MRKVYLVGAGPGDRLVSTEVLSVAKTVIRLKGGDPMVFGRSAATGRRIAAESDTLSAMVATNAGN